MLIQNVFAHAIALDAVLGGDDGQYLGEKLIHFSALLLGLPVQLAADETGLLEENFYDFGRDHLLVQVRPQESNDLPDAR